jgi:four helix bundle protein
LVETKREYVLSKQFLRSGTAVGALIREAQNAESKADFIHKFKIAAKEIEETIYWLELCKFSNNYPNVDDLIEQVNNISRIVNKIIITSKQK